MKSEKRKEDNRKCMNANYQRKRERWSWYGKHIIDYIEFVNRGKSCICCGKIPVTNDHIVGREFCRRADGSKGGRDTGLMSDFKKGNLQLLCKTCQTSKRMGAWCRVHRKYLGVWNYLPKMDDIEQ
jgi:hypothetical protein